MTLQLLPVILEATKSLDDEEIGPVEFDHPIGQVPEDDINVHSCSPSLLYAMHHVKDVHFLSQSDIEALHLYGELPSIWAQ